ncbi:hypothetical protein FACS189430_06240 [Bacteroidia bacterium]|nr:hypothetical protein FACS189430_06240 [Bacteroidia bacterium]
MKLGQNILEYSDGSNSRDVQLTLEWQETSSNHPPNKITAPVFPSHQAEVDSLYFAFSWQPATDDDGDAIADYEFMLSDDDRMLYPHSPNFNLYVSAFNEGIRPYFKVKETGWLNDGETYYWRVRAKDSRGAWGEWSDTWSFTPHGVMRPVNGNAAIKGQSVLLGWERNSTGKQPDFYKIYASNETNGFAPEDATFFALSDTASLMIPFKKDAVPKSFYRIAACDTLGQESLVSDVITLPYPYIYSLNNQIDTTFLGGGEMLDFQLLTNSRYYPYYYYGNDTTFYIPSITVLSKPDWLTYKNSTLSSNDTNLARKVLFMDSTQRSVEVYMDDGLGGTATQTIVLETAAKNRKPQLALTSISAACDEVYQGFVTSIDGDVDFGDTNYYTVLDHPTWVNFDIQGDTIHLYGFSALPTQQDSIIRILAIDSKNDSTIAEFKIILYPPLQVLSAHWDTAVEDRLYTYQFAFNKPVEKLAGISFATLSQWLHYNHQYYLSGTPNIYDLPDTIVRFSVYDRQCQTLFEDSVIIAIEHVNHAPVLFTESLPIAHEGVAYSAKITAFDVDSLIEDVNLRYEILPAYTWLTIDSITGKLSGIWLANHVSDTTFQFIVRDRHGYSDSKILNISLFAQDKRFFGKNNTCTIIQPSREDLHYAKIEVEETEFQYYICTIAGALIYVSPKQHLDRGTHYLSFNMRHQPFGMYIFVGIENGKKRYAIKFMNNY